MSYLTMSREELANLSLFELRAAARECGIFSPTTMNKNSLIENLFKKTSSQNQQIQTSNKFTNFSKKNKSNDEPFTQQFKNNPKVASVSENVVDFDINNDVIAEEASPATDECVIKEGILDVHPDGYGFIRINNCQNSDGDAYIAAQKIKKMGLRKGDLIRAMTKVPNNENKMGAVLNVTHVNGIPFEQMTARPNFDDLVPIYPEEKIHWV
jgi:transcription termination factor Rho